jgi:hypothetical protein
MVSQQGASPTDLLMTSSADSFPRFARRERRVTGSTPPKKRKILRFVQDCGKILSKVKIDCAMSAANSRLSPRQMTGYLFPGFGAPD